MRILVFFGIISPSFGNLDLKQFCFDTLGPLIDYDHQNGTELIETLDVFLEQNQNATKAAKALFIHYNTLRYRLDCINDILSDALSDSQKRLAIEVALQIYPFIIRQENETI